MPSSRGVAVHEVLSTGRKPPTLAEGYWRQSGSADWILEPTGPADAPLIAWGDGPFEREPVDTRTPFYLVLDVDGDLVTSAVGPADAILVLDNAGDLVVEETNLALPIAADIFRTIDAEEVIVMRTARHFPVAYFPGQTRPLVPGGAAPPLPPPSASFVRRTADGLRRVTSTGATRIITS